MTERRVLSIAADCENVAMALMIDGNCNSIRMSRRAARKETIARSEFRLLVLSDRPDLIIFTNPDCVSAKGGQSRSVIRCLAQAAEDEGLTIIRAGPTHLANSGWLDRQKLKARFRLVAGEIPPPRRYPHKASKREVVVEALALLGLASEHLSD